MVSGKTEERVAAWAGVLADWLDGDGAGGVGRGGAHAESSPGPARQVRHCGRAGWRPGGGRVAGGGRGGIRRRGVVGAHEGACRAGTVFVYSGQGSQGGDGPAVVGR